MAFKVIHVLPLVLAMASSSLAQSTTVTLVLPGFDPASIDASVITAVPSATEYLLRCPTGQTDDECGLGTGITVTEGPSTVAWHMRNNVQVDLECKITRSADEISCLNAMSSGGQAVTTSTSTTGLSSFAVPVTVTAGAEKLKAQTKPAATAGSSAATGSASSPQATGGVPRPTQNLAFAGLAALVGGALVI